MKFRNNITGIILAGGKSSRIGTDKALLKFQDKTFIQTIYDNIKGLCSEVIISSNNPEVKIPGTKIVADKIENIGPAGGIFSALSASQTEKNMIVSVDTPLITIDLIQFLIQHFTDNLDALIIFENEKLHPLTGMYSKNLISLFKEEITAGNYKIRHILSKAATKTADISKETFYTTRLLSNINTSEDYAKLICDKLKTK